MAGRKKQTAPAEEPEASSPLAGGCVLLALGGAGLAGVFAASTEAGILVVWVVGVAAVWWSARRRKGTYQPLPSPIVTPSRGDVFAVETGRAARVVEGPGGVKIVHPEIEYVTDPSIPREAETPPTQPPASASRPGRLSLRDMIERAFSASQQHITED